MIAAGGKARRARSSQLALTWTLCGFLCLTSDATERRADPGSPRWRAHTGTAQDGSLLAGELGHIRVPENRSRPSVKSLDLFFVRYRTSHPNPGPPIFFLAGGPGGSGVEGAALVASHPQLRLLEHADVIGIEQRGTGLSEPDLTRTVAEVQLPLDRPLDRPALVTAVERASRDTVAYWRGQGVDLDAYNSVESADDIEAVRRALNLDQIVLYGGSYGSHLALAYLRRHGEHVARAVLSKVEGPNHTFKLPSTVQRHLDQLHRLAAKDPALTGELPDLLATVRKLLRKLAQTPVTSFGTDPSQPAVTLGPLDLQIELSRALSTSPTLAEIPAALQRFAAGDWRTLADAAREHRQVSLSALVLMMDCASGATADRWRRLRDEARDEANLLGDGILAPLYPQACVAAGRPDLGDAYRAAVTTDVPLFLTSGSLDARTPPSNVADLAPGLTRAVHVVATHAGHESRELGSPEYRDLLQAFLRGETVASCNITLPEPIFERLSEPETAATVKGSSRAGSAP